VCVCPILTLCPQLKLTDMIDGLWTIAVERADQAGRELAKVRDHGVLLCVLLTHD
jgi:hypothetical protein